ncbi:MAG: hypothetical protein HZB26_14205 [Candidatus Hydrogenedentes bacterium]|nr:hypothetical protein [Candidatus Hydrogenedentota bacterium]
MGTTEDEDVVTTNSRVRAWWLTTFKGYRVKTVRRQPMAGFLGSVRYECQWLLAAERSKN